MTQPKGMLARQDHIYEFLKNNEALGSIYISVADFRSLVGLQNMYETVGDLRNLVITTSLKQIKKNNRMDVTCESINKGGRTVGFLFVIENHNKLNRIANNAFSICATLK